MSTVREMRSVGTSFDGFAALRSADLRIEAPSVEADASVLLGDPFVCHAGNSGDLDF